MTFNNVRRVTSERLNEVLIYLNHISSLEPTPGILVSQELKIMKGLFFVQLYGALEKSTSDALQQLLVKIAELKPQNNHVILPFNVISMSRKWKSLKDSGYKDVLSRVKDFFTAIEASDFHGIEEHLFADLLQNIWAKTIDDITGTLGVTGFTLSVSERALIDELVDKRNAVAHGRESPSVVGEKYRCDDLRTKLTRIHALIISLIDRLETYLLNREFVHSTVKSYYP